MAIDYHYFETQQIGDGAEARVQWNPGYWVSLKKGLEALRANATLWRDELSLLTPATLRLYRVSVKRPAALEPVLTYQISEGQLTATLAPAAVEEVRGLLSEDPGLIGGEVRPPAPDQTMNG
jgi:hypothetical protein